MFYRLPLFIKICKGCFCFLYNLITCNHWTTNSTSYIFAIFTTISQIFTLAPNFIVISIFIRVTFSTIGSTFTFACFVNIFYSSTPVIRSKTPRFKSSDLFRIYTFLDQHDLAPRIYVLHKITTALKFMSYINQKLWPSYQTALNYIYWKFREEVHEKERSNWQLAGITDRD